MADTLNNKEDLVKRLVPDFPVGCRRLGPAEGFLESFLEENVELAKGEITSFTENGLRTTEGVEYAADVIICATGFDVNFRPYFPVVGVDGVSLDEAWKDDPSAYLALAASGFPNFMSESFVFPPRAFAGIFYGRYL
jgi:cation diffusion facilitator CzcD-associated flavoprotein CzcO